MCILVNVGKYDEYEKTCACMFLCVLVRMKVCMSWGMFIIHVCLGGDLGVCII